MAHIFKLDFAWQEKENSGNKVKRIDKGLDGVNITIRRIFNTVIEVLVNIVGIVAIFLTLEFWLSVSLVIFLVIYFTIGTYLLRKAIKQEKLVNKSFENLGGITFESLNNIQTIKSLAIDKGVVNLVGRYTNSLIRKIKKRIYLFQTQYGILLTYRTLFEFGVITTITWGIVNGRYDIGLLVLFIGLFQRVRTSASELTEVVQELAIAKIWISRTKSILATEPTIENPIRVEKQLGYPADWKNIRLEGVSFSYKKNTALAGVSFVISRGEKVGIVGLSGAGKSTLFKLFLDLYENYKGEILIDGMSLKNIRMEM